jgi:hypothetical protein
MTENTKEAALAAGAKTDWDFSFFSQLDDRCEQIRTRQMSYVSAACEKDREGELLLHGYYLAHGRFYEPQPRPKGNRWDRAKKESHL